MAETIKNNNINRRKKTWFERAPLGRIVKKIIDVPGKAVNFVKKNAVATLALAGIITVGAAAMWIGDLMDGPDLKLGDFTNLEYKNKQADFEKTFNATIVDLDFDENTKDINENGHFHVTVDMNNNFGTWVHEKSSYASFDEEKDQFTLTVADDGDGDLEKKELEKAFNDKFYVKDQDQDEL